MSELICHAYDCTIKTYIDAAFLDRQRHLVISGEPTEEEIGAALQQIQDEFTDCMTDRIEFVNEYFLQLQVFRMEQKVHAFEMALELQNLSINTTGEPFAEGFEFLKKYNRGKLPEWNGDIEHFRQQLTTIHNYFRPQYLYLAEDRAKLKKHLEEQKEKPAKEQTKHQSFASFIQLLNHLKTHGITFDKEKDFLIELGFAVQMIMKKNEKNPV